MMVFKRKHIVVLALILMIIVAGYLQYSYKKSSSTAGGKDEGRLGEAVYVDSQEMDGGYAGEEGLIEDNKTKAKKASKHAEDFFAQAKLDKEIERSRDVDVLKEISGDENADVETKAEAYDRMMIIVDQSQIEANIETLIKERGFEDAVAFFAADGSLDIIIKTPSLNSADTAQIADIAMRHGNVEMDQVHIRNIY